MKRLILFLLMPFFVHAAPILPANALLDWRSYFIMTLLLLVIIILVREIFPPDLTLLVAGAIPVIIGIVPPKRLLFSFANETIVTIAMLFIVVRAFERSGLILFVAQKILPKAKERIRQLIYLLPPLSFLSAFLNNTPIVMVLTPVVRRWSLSKNLAPSKFLIPISYAAILGGTCTLIGTSTNLIVNGLLMESGAGFSFFEIGKIGIFCAIAGLFYLIFFSHFLLPECRDPKTCVAEDIRKMTAEFYVHGDFSLNGQTVKEFGEKLLKGDFSLIEIRRDSKKITPPKPDDVIQHGDILVLIGDPNAIARLQKVHGIELRPDPDFELDQNSSHYTEFVVRSDSLLVGKTLRSIHFRTRLGGTVFAVYRQGKQLQERIGDITLRAGDVLMAFSTKPFEESDTDSKDLYLLKPSEELAMLKPKKAIFVSVVIVAMVLAASLGVPMMIAALAAAVLFIATKTVSGTGVIKGIDWSLLLLIAGALSFSSALEVTNVARFFGQELFAFLGSDPRMIIAGVFLLTTIITEFITNTAAVLIVFPIAMEALLLANRLTPDGMKGVGIAIAIAGSCSFLTPIGYQTNTIVYGPGGYRFFDYLKIGIPLNLIIWVLCIWLIPIIWQL